MPITLQLLEDTVTLFSIRKPVTFVNYVPDIRLSFVPEEGSSLVLGVLFIEQLTHDRRHIALESLEKLLKTKTKLFEEYKIHVHIVFFSNFESVNRDIQKETIVLENNIHCFSLPYVSTPDETAYLRDILSSVKKEYDVCFVGSINERRQKVIDDIKSSGLTINIIQNKFGLERDLEIAKCRVFMCPHYCDDGLLYENIRFDRFLFQGMPIISENCADEHILDIKDFVEFTEYQHIAARCKEVLDTSPSVPSTLELILKKRNQHLQSIHSILRSLILGS